MADDVIQGVLASSSMESVISSGGNSSDGGISGVIAKATEDGARRIVPSGGLTLTMLDLGDSAMTDTGAEKLATLIEANTGIQTLSLTGNKSVGVSGWLAVADALRSNTVIRTLSLDYNDLGNAGAAVMASALASNNSVESLDLEGNKIGNEGGNKLLKMLDQNTCLREITLDPGNDDIDSSIMQSIKEKLINRVVMS